jgi:HAMP domain-containing protein
MKKTAKAKTSTSSAAENITLEVPTTILASKTNGNGKHHKNGKNQDDALSDEIDNRELLKLLLEVKEGNFSVRMPGDKIGISGKICDTLNSIIQLNEALVEELNMARNTIGLKGHLNHRVELPRSAKGSWANGVDSINSLISDLVHPTIEIAHVISSVAKGNLSQEMPLKIGDHVLQGEFAKIAAEVNDMVKQLNLFSMEVTRVAREVGSEGKLGGQAKVKGVAGVWKDLTDSVNQMAGNLTAQVRNIAEVTTAVARGDLSK